MGASALYLVPRRAAPTYHTGSFDAAMGAAILGGVALGVGVIAVPAALIAHYAAGLAWGKAVLVGLGVTGGLVVWTVYLNLTPSQGSPQPAAPPTATGAYRAPHHRRVSPMEDPSDPGDGGAPPGGSPDPPVGGGQPGGSVSPDGLFQHIYGRLQ